MRIFLIVLCACGSSVPPAQHATAAAPAIVHEPPREPIDVIATLDKPLEQAASMVPGPAQLTLGGPQLQALDGSPPLDVDLLEEHGNDVRVGVRLLHVRFAVWTARGRMLSVILRETHLHQGYGPVAVGTDPPGVKLKAGAQVRRLAKKGDETQVRYIGALEVEGWVPSDAIGDRGPVGQRRGGKVPTGHKTLMVMQGAVVRAEPKWAGTQLAVANQSYFLDTLKELDDAWVEIGYEDDDIAVRGYLSTHDPPGRTHHRPAPESTTPTTPNVTVSDHTCLYANGEAIGFIDGAQPALVEKSSRVGWYTVTVDTPWSAVTFDAKGSSETELAPCAR
jgi:hypothetical protein